MFDVAFRQDDASLACIVQAIDNIAARSGRARDVVAKELIGAWIGAWSSRNSSCAGAVSGPQSGPGDVLPEWRQMLQIPLNQLYPWSSQ